MTKLNNYEITVGADIELFLKDKASGRLVSAYGLIPGTKEEPFPVRKGAVEVDGMAVEFLIDPAHDSKEFYNNIQTVLSEVRRMLPRYDLCIQPVAEFGADYIARQPKEASNLGCMPDYNAYTGEPNPRPNVQTPFRTASGHIHVGWTNGVDPFEKSHYEACCWLTQAMDAYLGMLSFKLGTPEEQRMDAQRRELYGKAGAFRPKPYGMEYRTMSNSWVTTPRTIVWAYEAAVKSVQSLLEDENFRSRKYFDKSAKQVIENSDQEALIYALHFNEILRPADYMKVSEEYEREFKRAA
jgi:hypothetical protein